MRAGENGGERCTAPPLILHKHPDVYRNDMKANATAKKTRDRSSCQATTPPSRPEHEVDQPPLEFRPSPRSRLRAPCCHPQQGESEERQHRRSARPATSSPTRWRTTPPTLVFTYPGTRQRGKGGATTPPQTTTSSPWTARKNDRGPPGSP